MKKLLLVLAFCLTAPSFADFSAPMSHADQNDSSQNELLDFSPEAAPQLKYYFCGVECSQGNCSRWCSTQQRCQAVCSPQGQPSCACFL